MQEQGVQLDPQKVINSLVRQLSEAAQKIALLEAYSEEMATKLQAVKDAYPKPSETA